jgi:hypothetical protein
MAAAADRLEEIRRELAAIGPVLAGSVSERATRCQRSGCHCRTEPAVLHGPYPTWTWRPAGRPITKTLNTEEADRLRRYADAHRRLKQLVTELEHLSIDLIDEREGTDLATAVGNR